MALWGTPGLRSQPCPLLGHQGPGPSGLDVGVGGGDPPGLPLTHQWGVAGRSLWDLSRPVLTPDPPAPPEKTCLFLFQGSAIPTAPHPHCGGCPPRSQRGAREDGLCARGGPTPPSRTHPGRPRQVPEPGGRQEGSSAHIWSWFSWGLDVPLWAGTDSLLLPGSWQDGGVCGGEWVCDGVRALMAPSVGRRVLPVLLGHPTLLKDRVPQ